MLVQPDLSRRVCQRLETVFGSYRSVAGGQFVSWRIGVPGSSRDDCRLILAMNKNEPRVAVGVLRLSDGESLLDTALTTPEDLEATLASVRAAVCPAAPSRVVGIPE